MTFCSYFFTTLSLTFTCKALSSLSTQSALAIPSLCEEAHTSIVPLILVVFLIRGAQV